MAKTGASKGSNKIQDLTDRRFGWLRVISFAGMRGIHSTWLCQCDCGKQKIVFSTNLKRKITSSCGCKRNRPRRHAESTGRSPNEYRSYCNMLNRCFNPKTSAFHLYGGRGILVDDRWVHGEHSKSGFDCFLQDMGARPTQNHSLDRIDPDGPYSAANCRWATKVEQQRNRRDSVYITAHGVTRTLAEWSHLKGMHKSTIQRRLARGLTPEESLVRP